MEKLLWRKPADRFVYSWRPLPPCMGLKEKGRAPNFRSERSPVVIGQD